MAERDDPTEQTQLKIRLRELLLARLQSEAEKNGYPLQTEITRRLEESVRATDLGAAVFGASERFGLLAALDRLILAVEMKTGKSIEDRDTRHLIADSISGFLKDGLELYRVYAGRPLAIGEVRSLADSHALMALAALRGRPAVFPADPGAAEAAAAEAEAAAAEFVKRFPDHPFSRMAKAADAAPGEAAAGPADEAA